VYPAEKCTLKSGWSSKNQDVSLGCANGDDATNRRKAKHSSADDIKIFSGHAIIILID